MTAQTKYAQIYDYLHKKIRTGQYPAPGKLESEAELCEQFSTSRPTVRQALQLLEQEGLVYRRKGSGTYVRAALAAPMLSAKREHHGRVGLIVPTVNCSPYIELSEAIERQLTERGYTTLLRATNHKVQTEREILTEFSEVGVDGFIVCGTQAALPCFNTDLYEQLRLEGIACVFLNEGYAEPAFPTVSPEDGEAAEQLVNYLVALGHRSIACLCAVDSVRGHARYAGYLRGLHHARLGFSDALVGWYAEGEEERAVEAFSPDTATACLCQSDRTARLLIENLAAHGVRVPEDVSVVCIGSVDPTADGGSLTAALCPGEALSRSAVETLLQAMEGERVGSVSLPMTLHIGDTAAPPKKHNPIIGGNWASPFVLCAEDGYYLYPTRRWDDTRFYVFYSDNLLHWSAPKPVLDLRDVPWATEAAWSPSVIYYNGMYYMAYNADRLLGIARSASPTGPFESVGEVPLFTGMPDGIGLPLDPHLFLDHGKPYLLYGLKKCWLVPLDITRTGEVKAGTPLCLSSRLFTHDGTLLPLDKSTFNGAARVQYVRGRYLLTWSCYDTRDPRCQITYAWADQLEGPYTAPENNVLLKGGGGVVGTGHGCVVEQGDNLYLFYHRLSDSRNTYWQEMHREVCVDAIDVDADGNLTVRPTA